jgi:hypothetical protein
MVIEKHEFEAIMKSKHTILDKATFLEKGIRIPHP